MMIHATWYKMMIMMMMPIYILLDFSNIMLMLMLDLWAQAGTPGVTHFERTIVPLFIGQCILPLLTLNTLWFLSLSTSFSLLLNHVEMVIYSYLPKFYEIPTISSLKSNMLGKVLGEACLCKFFWTNALHITALIHQDFKNFEIQILNGCDTISSLSKILENNVYQH